MLLFTRGFSAGAASASWSCARGREPTIASIPMGSPAHRRASRIERDSSPWPYKLHPLAGPFDANGFDAEARLENGQAGVNMVELVLSPRELALSPAYS